MLFRGGLSPGSRANELRARIFTPGEPHIHELWSEWVDLKLSHKVGSLIKCFWSWYYNILRVSDYMYTVSSPTYLLWLEGLHLKANVTLISRITKMLGKRIKANDFEAFGILWEKILRNTMFWLWIKPPLKIPVWNLIKKTEIGNLRFAKNKTLRDAKRGENVWVFWAKVGISGYNW